MQNAECGIGKSGVPGWKLEYGIEGKPSRVKVPLSLEDWLPNDFRGSVRLERAFGLPTNLGEHQQIHLVIETEQLALSDVSINNRSLQNLSIQPDLIHCNVRPHLKNRNHLALSCSIGERPRGNLIGVRLEIHG